MEIQYFFWKRKIPQAEGQLRTFSLYYFLDFQLFLDNEKKSLLLAIFIRRIQARPINKLYFPPHPPTQKMGSYITILPPHNHSGHFHLSPRWPLCRGSAVFKFAHRAQMSTSLTPLLLCNFCAHMFNLSVKNLNNTWLNSDTMFSSLIA